MAFTVAVSVFHEAVRRLSCLCGAHCRSTVPEYRHDDEGLDETLMQGFRSGKFGLRRIQQEKRLHDADGTDQ